MPKVAINNAIKKRAFVWGGKSNYLWTSCIISLVLVSNKLWSFENLWHYSSCGRKQNVCHWKKKKSVLTKVVFLHLLETEFHSNFCSLCVLFLCVPSCCIFSGDWWSPKNTVGGNFPSGNSQLVSLRHTRVKWVPVFSCSGSTISSKKDNAISREFDHFFCPISINHCRVISWNKVRITPAA